MKVRTVPAACRMLGRQVPYAIKPRTRRQPCTAMPSQLVPAQHHRHFASVWSGRAWPRFDGRTQRQWPRQPQGTHAGCCGIYGHSGRLFERSALMAYKVLKVSAQARSGHFPNSGKL